MRFRPVRLLAISLVLTVVAIAAAGSLGHPMVGVFFGVGLLLGLLNAVGVQRSVAAITAEAHPLKKKMAMNSASRLLIITVIGLAVAFVFRPAGLGVVFGLALFQVSAGGVDRAAGLEEAAHRDRRRRLGRRRGQREVEGNGNSDD